MDIGDRLKQLRKRQNLTARELSELSSVPEKTIYRIETGEVKDPKTSSIIPLIKALKCSADDLLLDNEWKDLSDVLKSYLEGIFRLPAKEKLVLIKIIEKFIAVDQLQNINHTKMPKEIIEYWETNRLDNDEIDRLTEKEEIEENDERLYCSKNKQQNFKSCDTLRDVKPA